MGLLCQPLLLVLHEMLALSLSGLDFYVGREFYHGHVKTDERGRDHAYRGRGRDIIYTKILPSQGGVEGEMVPTVIGGRKEEELNNRRAPVRITSWMEVL